MTRSECILVMIQEECAELSKCCAKALRFGLSPTRDGNDEYDNSFAMRAEVVDLLAILDIAESSGLIDLGALEIPESLIREARDKKAHYISVSASLGRVS